MPVVPLVSMLLAIGDQCCLSLVSMLFAMGVMGAMLVWLVMLVRSAILVSVCRQGGVCCEVPSLLP